MKAITSILVKTNYDNTRTSVSWGQNGYRFHVWFDIATRQIERASGTSHVAGSVYKNPTCAAFRGDPGYFPTRYLDAGKPGNIAVLRHVFKIVDQDGLIAKAMSRAADVEAERLKESRGEYRIRCMKEAGPQMFKILESVRGTIARAPLTFNQAKECGLVAETKKIDNLLASIEHKATS